MQLPDVHQKAKMESSQLAITDMFAPIFNNDLFPSLVVLAVVHSR